MDILQKKTTVTYSVMQLAVDSFKRVMADGWRKRYQLVSWGEFKYVGFIRGNLTQPAAYYLIYKWSLWLGWWEVRRWLTDDEMQAALRAYNDWRAAKALAAKIIQAYNLQTLQQSKVVAQALTTQN